ncbi:WD repeat-containing protein 78-like [Octopus sinensis]|uniref:Dynein axonemal intermediate chain 4 n=1 Tax=Octopus sinensis TaxID=2607531 RepID=A0A6P7T2X7_9MOLL|nr:WD repeat-containing protein 78-like [Octopus sinensis]
MEQKSTKTQQNRLLSGSRAGSRSVAPLRSRYLSYPQPPRYDKIGTFIRHPHVFNENNVDVTPVPLSLGKRSNLIEIEGVTPPESAPGVTASSNVSGGPFSRSIFNTTSHHDRIEEFNETEDIPSWEVVVEKPESPTVLRENDLAKEVDINLKESETFMLFELISTCVLQDTEEAKLVMKRNAMYHELVKNRVGNDRYVSKGVNTFNDPRKLKLVQTLPIKHMDHSVQVSNWDMYDKYRLKKKDSLRKDNQEHEDRLENVSFLDETTMKKGDQQTFDESYGSGKSGGSEILKSTLMSSLNSSISSQTKVAKLAKEITMDEPVKYDDVILQSLNFARDLFIMERIINLNTYQPKLAKYRNLPVSFNVESSEVEESASETDISPNLQKLWSFTCPLTKGHTVSCMAWNNSNLDLIAVGYGEFEFKNQKHGLACCWSMKNPEYPEKVFPHRTGVTALDFSMTYPNLLAVGFYDGGIAVYDMKLKTNTPVQTSFLSSHRHTSAVTEVKWIERDSGSEMSEKVEYLISISKDGRISSWAILKGFECTDMMHLRRIGRSAKVGPKLRERRVETYISRYACGTCISFQPGIPNIYMVGTEDGHIHKCSLSYNEQYLDTYNAHTAPVYSITWSPFLSDVFLSAGGDWTVKLWHQNRLVPILKFFSSIAVESKPERPGRVHLQTSSEKTVIRLKTVYSVAWSPTSSTVFACVNHDEVEVWDLSQDILDPIIHYNPLSGSTPIAPTCVSFAKNSECLLVGDSGGNVTVLQLENMPSPPPIAEQRDILTKILTVSLATQLCNPAEAENIVGCKDTEHSSQS